MKQQFTICAVALLSAAMGSQAAIAGERCKGKGQGKHLSRFINKFDSNGDNSVSKEEFVASMEQRYLEMDADADGTVSQEEFKNYAKGKHKDFRKKNKGRMDTDNDGLISQQEYLDATLKRAEKKFLRQDKDNDGFLSEEERIKKRSRFKKPGHYFHKIDKNGDGVISFEESKASSDRLFEKLDNNKDMVITQEEIQAMSQSRKKWK